MKSITRSLIIFKKARKIANYFLQSPIEVKKLLVIFLGFLKMIKLVVILFIIKLYARNNIFKK